MNVLHCDICKKEIGSNGLSRFKTGNYDTNVRPVHLRIVAYCYLDNYEQQIDICEKCLDGLLRRQLDAEAQAVEAGR